MTYAQLTTAIVTLADDPSLTATQASIWLNANYQTLCAERDWPFLVGSATMTVTSGTQEYALSGFTSAISDFGRPLRVWLATSSTADKQPLTPINYEERNVSGLTNSYYITPNGLSLGLVPSPTNSTNIITLDYMKTVNDLDGVTYDEPVFNSSFHWILVWKALMNYQFQQRESSEEFRQQYEDILDKMLKFYFSPQAATNHRLTNGMVRRTTRGTTNPLNW